MQYSLLKFTTAELEYLKSYLSKLNKNIDWDNIIVRHTDSTDKKFILHVKSLVWTDKEIWKEIPSEDIFRLFIDKNTDDLILSPYYKYGDPTDYLYYVLYMLWFKSKTKQVNLYLQQGDVPEVLMVHWRRLTEAFVKAYRFYNFDNPTFKFKILIEPDQINESVETINFDFLNRSDMVISELNDETFGLPMKKNLSKEFNNFMFSIWVNLNGFDEDYQKYEWNFGT